MPGLDPAYPIRTPRLLLRPVDPAGDLEAMLRYRSRADVCRWIPPEPATRASLAARLADPDLTRSQLTEAGQTLFLVVTRHDGVLVGDAVLFWHSAEHAGGELGYIVDPDHAGRGYATEVARALLALGFGELGLHRITGRVDVENRASAAVLRRAGMRQEAVLVEHERFKGRWSTEVDFAILDHEWRGPGGSDLSGAGG